jgi:hypothetical protein
MGTQTTRKYHFIPNRTAMIETQITTMGDQHVEKVKLSDTAGGV